MKTLVVYYSLTDKTQLVASELAKSLGADLLSIEPVKRYSLFTAFLLGAMKARRGGSVPIKPFDLRVADYECIFIGTPVWASRSTPVINAFIEQSDFDGKKTVLFALMGGTAGNTLTSMRERIIRKGGTVVDSFAIKTGGVQKSDLVKTIREIAKAHIERA
jgi:flavodoxin